MRDSFIPAAFVPQSRSLALLKDYPSNETPETATAIPTSGTVLNAIMGLDLDILPLG